MLRALPTLEFPNQGGSGRKHEYEILQELGEGSFARVYLVRDRRSRALYAAKVVDKKRSSDPAAIKKEISIHAYLKHSNIINLISSHEDKDYIYLLMEYACGGELFDRIAPDEGLEEDLAHFYFVQLVDAVEYLHGNGVAHRDLKPENILLDDQGNLKLSDFGLASVFRYQGKTRMLKTACGTPPYVAPEIHQDQYAAEPVDVWSTGVILYVLLAGNTPWDEPTGRSPEFVAYASNPNLDFDPWCRFSPEALSLVRNMLSIDPRTRYTIADVKHSAWYRRPNRIIADGKSANVDYLIERLNAANTDDVLEETPPISYSQPDMVMAGDDNERGMPSFSQPIFRHHLEDSLSQPTQGIMQTHSQAQSRLAVDRLMRFFSARQADETFRWLTAILDEILVPHKAQNNKITFNTVDKRKCPLRGDIRIQQLGPHQTLVCFKKRKGDPVEARRFFKHCHAAFLNFPDQSQGDAMDVS
ncbi:kinase-like domain-containing protein [Hyaloraphidium curvatum]|nr:kinase-like domain-containing protein [Hyaloraphidium curvatum]